MKKITTMILALALITICVNSQSVTDLKKQFEDCFKKEDYSCAEKTIEKLIKKEKDSKVLAFYYFLWL